MNIYLYICTYICVNVYNEDYLLSHHAGNVVL